MLKLVQQYARRQPDGWPTLFYRILNNRNNDWHRRGKVSRRWLSWWGNWKMRDDEGGLAEPEFAGNEADDPMQQLTQSDAMQDLVDVGRRRAGRNTTDAVLLEFLADWNEADGDWLGAELNSESNDVATDGALPASRAEKDHE